MKVRESNIKLLRIILMLMIVGLHLLLHGQIFKNVEAFTTNYYMANLLECFFVVAVNCFLLISGYFGIKNPISKVFKLEFQLIFYSFFITLLFYLYKFNNIIVTEEELIFSLFPVLTNKWWFVSFYVIVMLLSPFLKKLVDNLDKKELRRLLFVLFIFFSLLTSLFAVINLSKIFPKTPLNLIDNRYGHSFNNFIFMYLIGAYLGKYKDEEISNKWYKYLFLYLLFVGLNFGYASLTDHLTTKKYYLFTAYDNVLVVFASVALFKFFASLKFRVPLINFLSKLTFAVYLIHEHPLIRNILYKNFNVLEYLKVENFLPKAFYFIFVVYIMCSLVELVRHLLFDKLENRIIKTL